CSAGGALPAKLSATHWRLSARRCMSSMTSRRSFVLLILLFPFSPCKLREDAVHDHEIVALQRRSQFLEKGDLLGRKRGLHGVVPIRQLNPAAIAATYRVNGVSKRELINIASDGLFIDRVFFCQIVDGQMTLGAQLCVNIVAALIGTHACSPPLRV